MRRILMFLMLLELGVFGCEVSRTNLPYDCMFFTYDPTVALLYSVEKIGFFNVVKSQVVWEVRVPHAWQKFGLPALSPDGVHLAATVHSGMLFIWNTVSGELRASYKTPPLCGWWLTFLDERRIILGGQYLCHETRIIDITTGETLKTLPGAIYPLALSSNGRLLAAAVPFAEELIRVWDVATGEVVSSFNLPAKVTSMTFDRTGKFIAIGSRDGKIYLWDVLNGSLVKVFKHDSPVVTLVLSPKGQLLAASSLDDRIVIWTFPEGEKLVEVDVRRELLRLGLLPDPEKIWLETLDVYITSWSPDGKMISFSCCTSALGREAFILRIPVL